MTRKNRIYFGIAEFVGLLFFLGFIATKPLEASDDASRWNFSLVVPVAERQDLTLVSFSQLVVQGQVIGGVAVYDDPATDRPADYLELYDDSGHLLAVSWFDRLGIERVAVDRGFLEGKNELDGVFVVLLDGDSV